MISIVRCQKGSEVDLGGTADGRRCLHEFLRLRGLKGANLGALGSIQAIRSL